MTQKFKFGDDGKFYYEVSEGNWKKTSSKTITLGAKKGTITDGAIQIDNAPEGQVKWEKKGNNIIVRAYNLEGKQIGKVTLSGIGKEKTVAAQAAYTASLTVNGASVIDNFFTNIYAITAKNPDKKASLKGTYLNEIITGSNKNDTIKGVGGTNTIIGKKGSDKMYSGKGQDTFEIAAGDAVMTVNKKGKEKGGDIIYKSTSDDIFDMEYGDTVKYIKNKKDLIIKSTKDGVTDKVTIKGYYDPNGTQIQNVYVNGLEIKGKENSANVLNGTDGDDNIIGGKKGDYITTGGGNDEIEGGKGNDETIIDGPGNKTFIIRKGDGNDEIASAEPKETLGTVSVLMPVEGEDILFSYAKDYQDLILTARHEDGTTESVRINNYFDVNIPIPKVDPIEGDFNTVTLNGENVENKFAEEGNTLIIGGVKVSQLIKDLEIQGSPLINYTKKLNIPASLGNANVYLGTDTSNLIVGSSGNEVMLSTGGNNYYSTGKNSSTAIFALGEGNDVVDVENFKKGTYVYDEDGDYTVTMNNVDVNNLHLIKSNVTDTKIFGHDIKNVKTFTTTDGISKAETVDLVKIGQNAKIIKGEYDENGLAGLADDASMAAIKTLLGMAPSAINSAEGVTVATGADFVFTDVDVTDTKGNADIISKLSQEVIHQDTSDALYAFLGKYGFEQNPEGKKEFAKFLFGLGETYRNMIADDPKKYNEIKTGFFNMFKTLYVGTEGDNSYTLKKSDIGATIASGKGSDTFTFSGEIGVKDVSLEDMPVYNIKSSLDDFQHDTIKFTGLTLGKDIDTLGLNIDEDNFVVNGITFDEIKEVGESEISSTVNYESEDGAGFSFADSKFSLTVQDKSQTYEFSAEHNSEDAIEYNWAVDEPKVNHFAATYADNTVITSNKASNIIEANALTDGNAQFEYTYCDGHDDVTSFGVSNDKYSVEVKSGTDLTINDLGEGDNDSLIINNSDLSKVKLFYNADTDGNIVATEEGDGLYSLVYGKSITKSNFNIETEDEETFVSLKNGASFNLNLGDAEGVEDLLYHRGNVDVAINLTDNDHAGLIDAIKADVAAWFDANQGKGYTDVYDVIASGNKNDIAGVLACYDKNLQDYLPLDA